MSALTLMVGAMLPGSDRDVWTGEVGSQQSRQVLGHLDTVGVRSCVLADLGIAIASEWVFAPELKSGAVHTVLTDWLLPPVDLWAIFPTGRQASAKARGFASFIESQMLNRDRFQQQMGAEN